MGIVFSVYHVVLSVQHIYNVHVSGNGIDNHSGLSIVIMVNIRLGHQHMKVLSMHSKSHISDMLQSAETSLSSLICDLCNNLP